MSNIFSKQKTKQKRKASGAFTMLELLFALSIWILGFTSIIGLFQLVIESGGEAKDRLVAANLAQEGVEIVHSIRDSNYVEGDDWTNGLEDCIGSGEKCELDYQSSSASNLIGSPRPLQFSSSTGAYGYSLGAPNSPFSREVRLREDEGNPCSYASSSDCMKVEVEINWQRKGEEKNVEIENYIFNWD